MDRPNSQLFISQLSISLFLAIMGIWIPFVHLYLLNAGNLTLPLAVHLPLLGMLSAALVAISLAVQTLLQAKHRRRASCVLLLVGIFMWAEGTLFIGDYGFLTGGFLDWGKNLYTLFLELLLAGILGFLVFRLKGALVRNAAWISGALIFSALANVFPAYQAKQSHTTVPVDHTFTQEGVFEISSRQNVLIFIIDTFQSDVFAELLSENLELKNQLSGFTYFPDATSAFPKTYTSVPNLLTGRAFDNSQPFALFQQEAYLGQSAPKVLKDNGFDVRYKTFYWPPYLAHPDVVDNVTNIVSADGRLWIQQDEFLQLFNLAVFRLTPFLAKPWVYHKNEWRITKSVFPKRINTEPYQLVETDRKYSQGNKNWDLRLLDQMMTFLTADNEIPTFRVFHFLGVHEPMVLDKDLNLIDRQEKSRAVFKDQAAGMLKLINLVFSRLQELEAYDNSLIFVVGDHGASDYEMVGVREDGARELGLDVQFSASEASIDTMLIQGGTPLILAKPIGRTGALAVSDMAVELGDIPQTVFSELELPPSAQGLSLFETSDTQDRIRVHRRYLFAGLGQDYLLPMTEYEVSGFSWNPASWSLSGRDLNQFATASFEGKIIVLGEGGNFDEHDHEGWSTPLFQGREISGGYASVVIPWEQVAEKADLELRMSQKFSPNKPLPITVFVEGKKIENWVISKSTPNLISTVIPSQSSGNGSGLEIRFELEQNQSVSPLLMEIRIR